MLVQELLGVKEDLLRLTSKNGVLICSGLLSSQENMLINALEALKLFPVYFAEYDEWRSIIFQVKEC